MSRTALLALLCAAAACTFAPQIGGDGYTSCEESSQCAPGRHCEFNFCVPPTWWDDAYAARYQILVENEGSEPVPAGALGEILIGDGGDLTLEQAGYGPIIVYDDRGTGEHDQATALRDPRGELYAFVFQLPKEVAPRTILGDLWLYVGGSVDHAAPDYSDPAEVYGYFEPFDGETLSTDAFRWEGDADLGGGQLVLRTGAWLVTEAVFEDSAVAVDLQLYGAACTDFGIGVGARHTPQSWDPPYAFFIGDSDGQIRHEVYSSSLAAVEVQGETLSADGLPHRFSVAVAGAAVVFAVDQRVTASWEPEYALADTELHLHLYTRDCDMRVESARAAPRPVELPSIQLGERVVWVP